MRNVTLGATAVVRETENIESVVLYDSKNFRTIKAERFEYRAASGKAATLFLDAVGNFWALASDGATAQRIEE